MSMTRLERALLEVLRDGGAALVTDLDTLLATQPRGTGQDSVVATDEEIAPVIDALVAKNLVVRFGDDKEMVAWMGLPHPDFEPQVD